MQISAVKQAPKFEPVTVTIVLESQVEVDALYGLSVLDLTVPSMVFHDDTEKQEVLSKILNTLNHVLPL
jgi:hypothetical protein